MLDWLDDVIINGADFASLLGDMYEPTCSAIIVGLVLISFAAACSIFVRLISYLFGGH